MTSAAPSPRSRPPRPVSPAPTSPGRPDDQARLLAAIEKGCDRLEHLIDNLLNLSRLQMGAINPLVTEVDLDDAVAWTLDTIPGSQRIRVDIPEALPPALVDPGLLDRVLANIVENALRHTPPDAPITLRITPPQTRHRGGFRFAWSTAATVCPPPGSRTSSCPSSVSVTSPTATAWDWDWRSRAGSPKPWGAPSPPRTPPVAASPSSSTSRP